MIFGGNPGVGKSTLLNGLIGAPVFKSGLSFPGGLTKETATHEKNGIVYVDVPGLSDVKIRKQAGEEITKALKLDATYKIIFLFTLEGGRVRPEDKATMDLILKCAPIGENYGVVLNKMSKTVLQKLADSDAEREAILASLFVGVEPSIWIYYNQYDPDLDDLDDVVKALPEELVEWMTNCVPTVTIKKEEVKPIGEDNFEKLYEKYAQIETNMAEGLLKAQEVLSKGKDAVTRQAKVAIEKIGDKVNGIKIGDKFNGILMGVLGAYKVVERVGLKVATQAPEKIKEKCTFM